MQLQSRFLLDRDPTENDIKEMMRWTAIKEYEVQRIVNVLDHFKNNVFIKPKLRALKGARA